VGADPFLQYAEGPDPATAFRQARRQALHEHGHDGNTGSVAQKDTYTIITDRPLTPGDAETLARELLACADPRIADKRGPAGAVAVRTELRTIDVPGLPQPAHGQRLRGTELDAVLAMCRRWWLLYADETVVAARWSAEAGSGSPPLGCARLTLRRSPSDPCTTPVPDGWLFFGMASN
jgi:hypothetical protein